MRNGRKFNILEVMHFLVILTFILYLSPCALAQNTELLQEASTSSPQTTVTLEAKAVQIVLNDEHRQGVDWEAIVSDFHSLQLKKEGNPVWADKKYRLSIGEVSNDDYTVLLEALDTVGHVSQNEFLPAVLHNGELTTIDLLTDPQSLPSIRLDLKWFSSPAGQAKLKVEPIIGVILKDSSQPNTVFTLRSQTEVDLVDNMTVVIGGLFQEEEITTTHKFPLLGDLPLVGLVFRKQGRLMQKTETIIFLKMHTAAVQMPTEEQK